MRSATLVVAVALCTLMVVPAVPADTKARSAPAEELLADLNAASDGAVAIVTMSCLAFTPATVTIQSGGSVTWLYAEQCPPFPNHTVTNSGSTMTDPAADRNKPQPHLAFKALCFNSSAEEGFLNANNPSYTVSFTFAGLLVRDVGAATMKPCPGASSLDLSGATPAAVVPYFCAPHGSAQPAGAGMRGAVIVAL